MGRMVLYADCIPRLRFFERLGRALRELRTPYVILTHRLSVRVLASEHGLPSRLARLSPNQSQADVRGSLEVVAGNLTAHHAQALYWSVYRTLQRMLAEHGISTIVVWNGDGVCGKAIRDFAEEHAVATLFLEVANLPGKLFADRRGVNARSALADDTSILSTYSPDMDEFQRWREDYIATKMRSHIVPQSRKRVPITGWPLVDWVGWQVLGCPRDSDLSVVDRAKRRFAARAHDYTYDDVGRLDPSSYVFYPMQVSNDSQVLINSTVDNRQAIKMAAMIADESQLPLYVKPHPAELDVTFVESLAVLRQELGFRLVGGNTFALIRNAAFVVTINSTVGLEALLVGRPVRFLGKTLFDKLHEKKLLAAYVMGYLLDIDYWGESSITQVMAQALLERAG